MKYAKGDLLKMAEEGKFDVIVHGCNCFNTMGAGIARQIARRFPEAYAADCETIASDISKLGTFSFHKYPKWKGLIMLKPELGEEVFCFLSRAIEYSRKKSAAGLMKGEGE